MYLYNGTIQLIVFVVLNTIRHRLFTSNDVGAETLHPHKTFAISTEFFA